MITPPGTERLAIGTHVQRKSLGVIQRGTVVEERPSKPDLLGQRLYLYSVEWIEKDGTTKIQHGYFARYLTVIGG